MTQVRPASDLAGPLVADAAPTQAEGPFDPALIKPGERVVVSVEDRAPWRDEHARTWVVTERAETSLLRRLDGTLVVMLRHSEHRKGWARWTRNNAGAGATRKTFSRWSTRSIYLVSAHPNGGWKVQTWNPQGGWHTYLHFADAGLGRTVAVAEPYLPAPVTVHEAYPCLSNWFAGDQIPRFMSANPSNRFVWAPAQVRRAFAGAPDAQALTRNLFGKSRYRRDLVRAVAQASMARITIAHAFRGLVPVDWIVAYLRGTSSGEEAIYWTGIPNLRPLLRCLDQQSLKSLLQQPPPHIYALTDMERFMPSRAVLGRFIAGEATFGRVRTWGDLHDQALNLFRLYRHHDGKQRRPKRLSETAQALEGTTPGGLRVELARHENTLWDWGTQMRHCIGGYGNALRRGSSLLGGVFTQTAQGEEALVANFEVITGRDGRYELRQLLGKANAVLPTAPRSDIVAHLAERDVVIGDYWGDDRPLPA